MIEFKNVNISFANFALKNISLKIKKATCHSILGPSGAGKSSIAKALLGLNRIDSGTIFYKNRNISNLEVQKRGFGYVPQHLALFPHMSVEQNLLFNGKNRDKFFEKLVKIANIEHLLNRYPNSLSGGEKQRVALIRALLTNSELLILDEPFSALDVSLKKELWILIDNLKKSISVSILLITHDLNEAYFLSDEISILIDGKIIQSDDKKSIFNYPKTIEVAKYLGYKNIFKINKINSNEFIINELNLKIKSDSELKSNITHIVIRSEDVKFVRSKDSKTVEGSYKILEFKDYNLIYFKLLNSNTTLEVKLSKNKKSTNYLKLDFMPKIFQKGKNTSLSNFSCKNFIFVTSSNS